jgi:hypothetical protein
MPGCILWLFAWYDGWNNSFNKGYEQAPVGPLTGFLGIFLFIGAMFYVPLAQARQASTGQWRSFYDWKLIWSLVGRHWVLCLFLALLYSILFIPLNVLKTGPAFWIQKIDTIAPSSKQLIGMLSNYFFWSGFAVVTFYVAVRWAAARIYARAILLGLQRGEIPVTALAEVERRELERLDLVQISPPRSRHLLIRTALSTSKYVLRGLGFAALTFVWFTFVAQIYIAEFFMYHPVVGWLNQPLVQLPWFRYVPAQLQSPGPEIWLTVLFLSGVCFLLCVRRMWTRSRRSTSMP